MTALPNPALEGLATTVPGGKIARNCWADGISNAAYHGTELFDGPAISSTGLKQIALDCPAIYWSQSPYNPARIERRSAALDFGKACHALQLGEPTFNDEFVVSPFDDFKTKAAREWRDAQDRTVITADQSATIQDMVAALKATPYLSASFKAGTPERSFFLKDKETGVWLKARPDFFPRDPREFHYREFKTAADVSPRGVVNAVMDFGYYIQAALAIDVIEGVLQHRILGGAHIFQMKTPPYLAEGYVIPPSLIDYGRKLYRQALRTFAECWDRHIAGKPERVAWPGYATAWTHLTPPAWLEREITRETGDNYDVTGSHGFESAI